MHTVLRLSLIHILKYGYQSSLTDKSSNQIKGLGRTITIPRLPNENSYAVPAAAVSYTHLDVYKRQTLW